MTATSFDLARFWSRVEVRKADQCWPWRYGTREDGYGEFRLSSGGSPTMAHRMAYLIAVGPIPEGLIVRHDCDNRLCCNWHHLRLGTHQDNVADRVERNRSAKGEEHGRAKLTEAKVLLMRRSPLSDRYFADRFEVDIATVQDARTGKTWAHI